MDEHERGQALEHGIVALDLAGSLAELADEVLAGRKTAENFGIVAFSRVQQLYVSRATAQVMARRLAAVKLEEPDPWPGPAD